MIGVALQGVLLAWHMGQPAAATVPEELDDNVGEQGVMGVPHRGVFLMWQKG
jgi:hypothetical protein